MLLEKLVMSAATDMIRHEIKSRFLRPSDESASVPRIRPPIRQPMKKDEAGRPVMNELAHYRDHSDMVVSEAGPFQCPSRAGKCTNGRGTAACSGIGGAVGHLCRHL
ncbi:hypothetical protein L3X38_022643 [Prunus dulcis]|uniref:Uncharacterized protein n=1 Tax=Prunus dulcis TaxID=3755 RepID=A0AAD4Z4S4_PRUDU|nr:hypothetical protein L3X38_022643 [Prunus dulcis]